MRQLAIAQIEDDTPGLEQALFAHHTSDALPSTTTTTGLTSGAETDGGGFIPSVGTPSIAMPLQSSVKSSMDDGEYEPEQVSIIVASKKKAEAVDVSSVQPLSAISKPRPPPKALFHRPDFVPKRGERNPPLELLVGESVTVLNGDKANLTWREFRLIALDEVSGQCTVVGSDGKQRIFSRKVVKPRGYMRAMESLFEVCGVDMEFAAFRCFLERLCCPLDYKSSIELFQSLDAHATGAIQFGQFVNWIHGVRKLPHSGKLLTMMECVSGLRPWHPSLDFDVLVKRQQPAAGKGKASFLDWAHASVIEDPSADSGDTTVLLQTKELGELLCSVPKCKSMFQQQFHHSLDNMLKELQPKFYPTFEDPREMSLVVMGASAVGKTALITKLMKRVFVHAYEPTTQEDYRKTVTVDSVPATLNILDTAGQKEFVTLRYTWLRDTVDVLVVCFSRADIHSFYMFQEVIIVAKRLLFQSKKPRKVPIVAVGTKSEESEHFIVTMEDINKVLDANGGDECIRYVECSTFTGANVSLVFETAVRLYRDWRQGKTGPVVISSSARSSRPISGSHLSHFGQYNSGAELSESLSVSRARAPSTFQEKKESAERSCFACCTALCKCCPKLGGYMQEPATASKRMINPVPVDQFPKDVSPPVFAVSHFLVSRSFSFVSFLLALLLAVVFPIVLVLQTILFLFYTENCGLCWSWLPDWDYMDPQVSVWFDFLSPIIGRDNEQDFDDIRKWFLSQTFTQRLGRVILCPLVCVLFVVSVVNCYKMFAEENAWNSYSNLSADKDNGLKLSVVEYLFPLGLWCMFWLISAWYVSAHIEVTPKVPGILELRPFVLYLRADESLRTTAYVYLRSFAKQFDIYRLQLTWERLYTSLIVAFVYAFVPGVTRTFAGRDFFTGDYDFQVATALLTNFLLVFVLTLVLQMQLMSGLQKYTEWMEDVTWMLDAQLSQEKGIEYLSLTRHSNALSWLEMRSFLFSKGVVLASRQEIFVGSLVIVHFVLAAYILFRILTQYDYYIRRDREGSKWSLYRSEAYNGLLLLLFSSCMLIARLWQATRHLDRLQKRQCTLLRNQKLKAYYQRVSWNGDFEEDDDDYGGDDRLPQRMKTGDAFSDSSHFNYSSVFSTLSLTESSVSAAEGQRHAKNTLLLHSMDPEYIMKSEALIEHVIGAVQVHDITPRVFNIKLSWILGVSLLAAISSVVPSAMKAATGNDCRWSD